ncbi:MAG: hypothetical protein AAF208_00725 [Cyanobacteria bacterium P01_A01_bin.45]
MQSNNEVKISNQLDLEEEAEKLGKKAMEMGLIPSFAIRYYPDVWQFSIPAVDASDIFTPEEAYLYLKKLLAENSGKS